MDVRNPLREAIFLIQISRQDIVFEQNIEEKPHIGVCDSCLIKQIFCNVTKNASEGIDAANGKKIRDSYILVQALQKDDELTIDIIDNGKGFPKKDRKKLLKPYINMREKGTGLRLAILRKIIEEHGEYIELLDAPASHH